MKKELIIAKKEIKKSSLPYQLYRCYLLMPLLVASVYMLTFLGFNMNKVSAIILLLIIIIHFKVRKLKLVSKIKYVAPILMYIYEGCSKIIFFPLFFGLYSRAIDNTTYIVSGLIVFASLFFSIVYFLMAASEIKYTYPNMKIEYKDSREKYLSLKKTLRKIKF